MAIDELFDSFEVLQNAPGLTLSDAAKPSHNSMYRCR